MIEYLGITGVDPESYAFQYSWLITPDEDETDDGEGA